MKYIVTIRRKGRKETEYEVSFPYMEAIRKQFDLSVDRALLVAVCMQVNERQLTSAEYYGRMSLLTLQAELGIEEWKKELVMDVTDEEYMQPVSVDTEPQDLGETEQ